MEVTLSQQEILFLKVHRDGLRNLSLVSNARNFIQMHSNWIDLKWADKFHIFTVQFSSSAKIVSVITKFNYLSAGDQAKYVVSGFCEAEYSIRLLLATHPELRRVVKSINNKQLTEYKELKLYPLFNPVIVAHVE